MTARQIAPRPAEHVARRPLWICRVDAQPWPCAHARLKLKREAEEDRTAVCVYLGAILAELTRDLYTLNPDTAPEPRALAERVLGWLPPRRPQSGRPGESQPAATNAPAPASAGHVSAEDA